jgi:type I restriction-modification system DNA methylase subunit
LSLQSVSDFTSICKSASLEEIKGHGYVLTPGRYVGAADVEDDQVQFSGLREIDAGTHCGRSCGAPLPSMIRPTDMPRQITA